MIQPATDYRLFALRAGFARIRALVPLAVDGSNA
jgi:hypothetical protein